MGAFLSKWFGRVARPARSAAAAPGVSEDERIEDLYEEFCGTFLTSRSSRNS
jgi:hypothetical protein